jgi:hypothetical protein
VRDKLTELQEKRRRNIPAPENERAHIVIAALLAGYRPV